MAMTDEKMMQNIERARRHARLTVDDIRILLDVSRVTYYNWLNNTTGRLRRKSRERIEHALRVFVHAFNSGQLPIKESVPKEQRQAILKDCRDKYQHDTTGLPGATASE